MTYQVGIIGLGIMGQRMLGYMAEHAAFEVVSAFDPQQSLPNVDYADSVRSLIENSDVDLVYVACPPAYHVEYAIAAAKAGKPVFCEKPLAVDIAQSLTLVETVEKIRIPNAVNFSFASSPSRAFLKSKISDGTFGEIDGIDIRLHFAKWPRDWQASANWLAERDQGGYVREVLSHFIYLTESVFGKLSLENSIVRYPGDRSSITAETHVLADLRCGKTPVSVAGGVGGTGPDRIEFTVWGNKQSCRLDDWYSVYLSDGQTWEAAMTEISDPRQAGRLRQLDNLAHFMSGRPHELPDFRAALSVQILIENILQRGGTENASDQ